MSRRANHGARRERRDRSQPGDRGEIVTLIDPLAHTLSAAAGSAFRLHVSVGGSCVDLAGRPYIDQSGADSDGSPGRSSRSCWFVLAT